jgi:DNA-binding XRE family transcriptional regulator
MAKKLLTLNDVLKDELKDKEFRKYYEAEGKELAIGYKIAQLRHKRGLTQKQLARKIHTTQTVIARLENGNYLGYSLKTLEKIAMATGSMLSINFR